MTAQEVSAKRLPPRSQTILIADDHPSVLRSVSELVTDWGYTVVAMTADGTEALQKLEELKPDIALVDLRMPGISGVEIAREAARTGSVPVLIYTGFGDQALLSDAMNSGARGVVLKEAPLEDLRRALGVVLAGGVYIDPVLSLYLLGDTAAPRLTPRELDVLRLLGTGCSSAEIGTELEISPETVRTHIGRATQKLGARTRTEAVASALRSGLIQ